MQGKSGEKDRKQQVTEKKWQQQKLIKTYFKQFLMSQGATKGDRML